MLLVNNVVELQNSTRSQGDQIRELVHGRKIDSRVKRYLVWRTNVLDAQLTDSRMSQRRLENDLTEMQGRASTAESSVDELQSVVMDVGHLRLKISRSESNL